MPLLTIVAKIETDAHTERLLKGVWSIEYTQEVCISW